MNHEHLQVIPREQDDTAEEPSRPDVIAEIWRRRAPPPPRVRTGKTSRSAEGRTTLDEDTPRFSFD